MDGYVHGGKVEKSKKIGFGLTTKKKRKLEEANHD